MKLEIPFTEEEMPDLLVPFDRVLIYPLNKLDEAQKSSEQPMMQKCVRDISDGNPVPKHWKTIYTSNSAVVVKAGKLCVDLKAGDVVIFGKYAGTDIKFQSIDCMCVRESDIFLILRSDSDPIGFKVNSPE